MAGYIQLHRGEPAEALLRYPNCFALLTLIAMRARRELPQLNPYGLQLGESLIGDTSIIGLTRQEFRTALGNLQKWGLVSARTTNKGTITRLCDSTIYNINGIICDQPANNQQTTNKSPKNNHQNNHQESLVNLDESSTYNEFVDEPNHQVNQYLTIKSPEVNQKTTTNKKKELKNKEWNKGSSLRSEREAKENEDFTSFWLAYPRKESKASALKAFAKLSPDEQAGAAQAAREWFGRRADWIGADGSDYRPHPDTWLNKKRWQDLTEITITQTPTPHTHGQASTTSQQSNFQQRSATAPSKFEYTDTDSLRAANLLLKSIGL